MQLTWDFLDELKELTIGFLGVGDVIPYLDGLKTLSVCLRLGMGSKSISISLLATSFPEVLSNFL